MGSLHKKWAYSNAELGVRSAELQRYKKIFFTLGALRHASMLFLALLTPFHGAETMVTIYPTPYSYFKGVLGTLLKRPRRARWLFCI
jgi:hypothetical protein